MRPRRCRVRKLPKPRISILSPFCNASMMLSKIVSTIVSDSFRGSSEMRSTSSIRSAFVNVGCLVIPIASSPGAETGRRSFLTALRPGQIGVTKRLRGTAVPLCPLFLSLNWPIGKPNCIRRAVLPLLASGCGDGWVIAPASISARRRWLPLTMISSSRLNGTDQSPGVPVVSPPRGSSAQCVASLG